MQNPSPAIPPRPRIVKCPPRNNWRQASGREAFVSVWASNTSMTFWRIWSKRFAPQTIKPLGAQHARDQRLDRADGMKVFGRDFRLRDGYVELQLDGEHQIDHLERADAEVAQLLRDRKGIGNRGLGP